MNHIDASKFKDLLISGTNNLINNDERIDALNVFPVPDGDTGSNMSATARSGKEAIESFDAESVDELAAKFAKGLLMGARGNSGVILSQIFKGLSNGVQGKKIIEPKDFLLALSSAAEQAYKAVMKPVEGTILTVIRVTAETLNQKASQSISWDDLFSLLIVEGRIALDDTPNLLPVLKEVGVVDSGGEGLMVFLEGFVEAFKTDQIIQVAEKAAVDQNVFSLMSESDDHDGEFGYCTEFIVEIDKPKEFNKAKYEEQILKLGNSAVVVVDEEILKTHVHSLKPGDVFNYAQSFGEFISIKAENMTLQANDSTRKATVEGLSNGNINKTVEIQAIDKSIGIISCNTGYGIIKDMKDYGADFIIEGGQSMNPSAGELIEAINKLPTPEVIILPNNSNIILTAQSVAQTVKDKKVLIIPTKTQMQGIAAAAMFDEDSDLASNEDEMLSAVKDVKTIQVTTANRSVSVEGVKVTEGEFISIINGKLKYSIDKKTQAAIKALEETIDADTEFVTIYFGEDATLTDANEIKDYIESNFDVEVDVKDGQQQIYHFLISVE